MKRAILAIAKNENQTQQIIEQLRSANFSTNSISVLIPQSHAHKAGQSTFGKPQQGTSWTPKGEVFEEEEVGYSRGTPSKGVTPKGTPQGGALTQNIPGLTTINIQGVGPYLAAGPLKSSLNSYSPTGNWTHLTGTFINLGLQEPEAKRLEDKIKKGSILVVFHSESNDELNKAKELFKRTGAEEVVTTAEVQSTKKSKAY